jgi:hypothetical protein
MPYHLTTNAKAGPQKRGRPGTCNLLAYRIINVTFCEWEILPLVPVIVSVKVPIGVVGGCSVRISKLDVPEPVTDGGGIGTLEPGNSPVTVKFTVPSNPLTAVTAMS